MLTFRLKFLDPVNGVLSPKLSDYLFEPLYKARQLLSHRSKQEVAQIGEALDMLWRAPGFTPRSPEEFSNSPPMQLALESGEIVEAWPHPDEVAVLEARIDAVDVSAIGGPPHLKKHELFAALALTFIEQSCVLEDRLKKQTETSLFPINEIYVLEQAQHFGTIASRAVSIAERLRAEDKKHQTRSSLGGTSRQIVTKQLKEHVLKLHDELFLGRSARDAATRILAILKNDGSIETGSGNRLYYAGSPALNTDDPNKRLEKWIGDHRKTRLA
ncbi:MAG: hypothetical protein KDE64_06815 [Rhodocyclaceae bacterium]|nr:hypothetical protein [Rhodocyclaceae bacterium]